MGPKGSHVLPVEVILGTVATLGAIGSALFGGGMLRQLFSHSNQMAVQKHELENTKKKVEGNDLSIQKLVIESALQRQNIDNFHSHIQQLQMLPKIDSRLIVLETMLKVIEGNISSLTHNGVYHDRKNT
jgi:hypothetical protein